MTARQAHCLGASGLGFLMIVMLAAPGCELIVPFFWDVRQPPPHDVRGVWYGSLVPVTIYDTMGNPEPVAGFKMIDGTPRHESPSVAPGIVYPLARDGRTIAVADVSINAIVDIKAVLREAKGFTTPDDKALVNALPVAFPTNSDGSPMDRGAIFFELTAPMKVHGEAH